MDLSNGGPNMFKLVITKFEPCGPCKAECGRIGRLQRVVEREGGEDVVEHLIESGMMVMGDGQVCGGSKSITKKSMDVSRCIRGWGEVRPNEATGEDNDEPRMEM
jgi:hypothetical protein